VDPLILAIVLYLVALLLLAIDIFVPTGGILLVCGAICAVMAIYFGFRSGTNAGLTMLLIVLATIPALFYAFLKVWPHTPIGRRVLLEPKKQSETRRNDELRALIGTVVINRWPLIPTGQIQIGHRRYNAMSSDGKTIEIKARVKVVHIYERMLVVSETTEPLTDQNSSSIKPNSNLNAESADPLQISAEQIGLKGLEE
jgi:membrane-bound ClpP family serine protease